MSSFMMGEGRLTISGCDIGSVTGGTFTVTREMLAIPVPPVHYVVEKPQVTVDLKMKNAIIRGDVARCQICGQEELALLWPDQQVTCIRCCYAAKALAEKKAALGILAEKRAALPDPGHAPDCWKNTCEHDPAMAQCSCAPTPVVDLACVSIARGLCAVGQQMAAAQQQGLGPDDEAKARQMSNAARLIQRLHEAAERTGLRPACRAPGVHASDCECARL